MFLCPFEKFIKNGKTKDLYLKNGREISIQKRLPKEFGSGQKVEEGCCCFQGFPEISFIG